MTMVNSGLKGLIQHEIILISGFQTRIAWLARHQLGPLCIQNGSVQDIIFRTLLSDGIA